MVRHKPLIVIEVIGELGAMIHQLLVKLSAKSRHVARMDRGSATTAAAVISDKKVYAAPGYRRWWRT